MYFLKIIAVLRYDNQNLATLVSITVFADQAWIRVHGMAYLVYII